MEAGIICGLKSTVFMFALYFSIRLFVVLICKCSELIAKAIAKQPSKHDFDSILITVTVLWTIFYILW